MSEITDKGGLIKKSRVQYKNIQSKINLGRSKQSEADRILRVPSNKGGRTVYHLVQKTAF